MYVVNAFSLNMVEPSEWHNVRFSSWSINNVKIEAGSLVSAIGHADTAAIVSTLLGVELPVNRADVRLERGECERILIAQYSGPRLPEGATVLPEGASIRWACAYLINKDKAYR